MSTSTVTVTYRHTYLCDYTETSTAFKVVPVTLTLPTSTVTCTIPASTTTITSTATATPSIRERLEKVTDDIEAFLSSQKLARPALSPTAPQETPEDIQALVNENDNVINLWRNYRDTQSRRSQFLTSEDEDDEMQPCQNDAPSTQSPTVRKTNSEDIHAILDTSKFNRPYVLEHSSFFSNDNTRHLTTPQDSETTQPSTIPQLRIPLARGHTSNHAFAAHIKAEKQAADAMQDRLKQQVN